MSTGLEAAAVLGDAHTIVAVGPLTNVADAVERPGGGELYVMGGEFRDGVVEHNIRCDVTAADAVFRSGRRATVIGLEQTQRLRLRSAELETVAAAGPLGRLLAAEMRQFWDFRGEASNVPHDPAAVLMLTDPELFEFTTGEIAVGADDVTGFVPGAGGPHRIVTDLDESAVAARIVDRILAACAQSPAASLEGDLA